MIALKMRLMWKDKDFIEENGEEENPVFGGAINCHRIRIRCELFFISIFLLRDRVVCLCTASGDVPLPIECIIHVFLCDAIFTVRVCIDLILK